MEENLNVVNATPENVVDSQEPVAQEVVESANVEVTPTQQTEEATKPVQSKEENAKFAEIRRKYEAEKVQAIQAEKDKLIAEMYGESHGIYTEADYKKAVEQAKKQEEIEKIKSSRNYTDEEAQEILEARQIKAEKERMDAEKQQQDVQRKNQEEDNKKFLDWFERENGRPFNNTDVIPVEVWQKVNQGESLKTAYLEYQLSQFKKGQSTLTKNIENAEASTGGVKGDGQIDSDFVSESEFDMKKSDQRWVMKNFDKINKSRLKW